MLPHNCAFPVAEPPPSPLNLIPQCVPMTRYFRQIKKEVSPPFFAPIIRINGIAIDQWHSFGQWKIIYYIIIELLSAKRSYVTSFFCYFSNLASNWLLKIVCFWIKVLEMLFIIISLTFLIDLLSRIDIGGITRISIRF